MWGSYHLDLEVPICQWVSSISLEHHTLNLKTTFLKKTIKHYSHYSHKAHTILL